MRTLAAACCFLLAGVAMLAQAREAGEDSLSGHWGHDGVTFLELKFDGKNTVSGTAIWRSGPGDEGQRAAIKTGSFDAKTGALKLEGDAKDPDGGAPAKFLIEGKLNAATLSGTFQFGSRSGEFSFTKQPERTS